MLIFTTLVFVYFETASPFKTYDIIYLFTYIKIYKLNNGF